MPVTIPPPPINAPQGDRVWTDWYVRLQLALSSTAGVAWALVDKAGSSLSDLANRTHAMLTGVQGSGSNHISSAENTTVTNINTLGHQGLTSINGTGNRHISVAEATDVTKLQTTQRLYVVSSAADPTTSDVISGEWIIWKNTALNEVRLWVNDGGTMKKTATLT